MNLLRQLVFSQLRRLRRGTLDLHEAGKRHSFGDDDGPAVWVEVRDPRFYRAMTFGGHLGVAEAYVDRWWDCNDLTGLVRILLRNRDVLDGMETGLARLMQPARKMIHALHRNTPAGSRRNISAHYDLSNEFFSLLLDDTLTYSCGIFERPESTLREASVAKHDRICQLLSLRSDDHVLEIGTGWGGFALHAATEYGCRVTTTTISDNQFREVSRRIAAAGMSRRITLLQRDYRDLEGKFDRLVSIEMIEAVGHQYLETFFRKCAGLLEQDGIMALQSITILPQYYDRALREVDFIKQHIFPGSFIPSLPVLLRAARKAGLRSRAIDQVGPHYAETLRRWRKNFVANWERIRALGFSEEFGRLWEFYFCYCEGGFREGTVDNVQLAFAKTPVPSANTLNRRPVLDGVP